MPQTPPVTGKQVIKLLIADGWEVVRQAKHGLSLRKAFPNATRIAVVPNKKAVLPAGTLGAILGPKQTALGKRGLRRLVDQHGL